MSIKTNEKKDQLSNPPRKPYDAPRLTKYGDIVEQTTRGHSGPDKTKKTQ
jgi:hypothetical protein